MRRAACVGLMVFFVSVHSVATAHASTTDPRLRHSDVYTNEVENLRDMTNPHINNAAPHIRHEALASAYDEATAVYLARITSVTYCQARNIRNWTCSPCTLVKRLEDIHVVEDRKDRFQGIVGYDPARNAVLIAFRGSMDIPNWIDNMAFVKTRAYPKFPGVKVHEGFYWVYQSVGRQVVPAVQMMLKIHPNASIIVTGHSLGAAVAALCTFDLTLLEQIPVQALYTFGEPRVGNTNFTRRLTHAVPQLYRITHNKDVVPHLPPAWIGYHHAAQEVYYDEYATGYRLCDPNDGEDPLCSDECSPFGCTSVVDHLTYVNVTMSHLIC